MAPPIFSLRGTRIGILGCHLAAGSLLLILPQGCSKPSKTPPAQAAAQAKLSFNQDVQPILAENCYGCHGPDPGSRKAGLRLDRAEFAFAPHGKSGPAIVRFNPDKSALIARVETTQAKERMPPPDAHKTLKPEEIKLLRRWVSEGAEYQEHWAFIPPANQTPPSASGAQAAWVRNDVDRFIVARLTKEGLSPRPEADRRSLIRRVALDLTGLPPTPEEVDAFLADSAPGAYERVVDRFLASSRFGEHRAHYWLDYVRYADTHGIHFDNYRAIWPYRDYVIRAFNGNKPFDQFMREQLAGDLLPGGTWDELAATGYIRCNLTTNEGGDIPEETFVNQTRDRVETFGVAFLGLTTGCAACHDHKFDPFTQKDFYSLAAYLNNTAEKPWDDNVADSAPVLRLPKEEDRASGEFLLARRVELQKRLDARRAKAPELLTALFASGHLPKPVSPTALELRLPLDEGRGDKVRNAAPDAPIKEFTADTNPLVWGESSWLWTSMRMDILTRLRLGNLGDVDAGDKFSGGCWLMLRAKPGSSGTGDGSLLSRMGEPTRLGGAGWEIYQDKQHFTVNLVPVPEPAKSAVGPAQPLNASTLSAIASAALGGPAPTAIPAPPAAPAASSAPTSPNAPAATPNGAPAATTALAAPPAAAGATAAAPAPPLVPRTSISVATKDTFPRNEWFHVFFTYDGSRKAKGVKIYVNGKQVPTTTTYDALPPKATIRTDASMQLGRRDDTMPMRETRFQDVRFYRRELTKDEVARLPFEDVAAEIVARNSDPSRWSRDESFVVLDRWFLGEVDSEAIKLAAAVVAHTAALDALTKDGDPTLIAVEKPTPAYADILKRGDYYSRVERVGPATPHFLPPPPAGAPLNRRGLADWLLSPQQPLFPRVTVNRMWQEIFGTGLVETAGDFGVMGAKPSHPELLDWLAVRFRESGWNVKEFYRLLVTSAAYRQSAEATPESLAKDPNNRLLSRGPRFRMDAEMLRDSALAVSGLLVEKIGGPSVKPYQPPGLWEEVAMPESDTKTYVPDHGDGLYRRSVYTFWKRGSMPPSMEAFDAISRETVCPRRIRTNTPLQAFVTMNDPQWMEAARRFAERAVRADERPEARLNFMAREALGRPLGAREAAVLDKSRENFRAYFAANAGAAREILAVGESPSDAKINPAELAEWTMTASQFLNLDEFLTK